MNLYYEDYGSKWVLQVRDSGTNYQAIGTSVGVVTGEWVFLVGRYDNGDMSLWVNGNKEATASQGSSLNSNSEPFKIGEKGTVNWFFNGIIDEVRIYDRALSQAEIQAYYNRTKGIFR